jgi:hypothetical protein
MVRAILQDADPKTQTRRPIDFTGCRVGVAPSKFEVGREVKERKGVRRYGPFGVFFRPDPSLWFAPDKPYTEFVRCPYVQPGQEAQPKPLGHLWVRESFCIESSNDYSLSESQAPKDGRPVQTGLSDRGEGGYDAWAVPWYRATDGEPNIVSEEQYEAGDDRTRWKPSIHMPRWASRILLEVGDVRVQRVQDISEEDASAEGLIQVLVPGRGIGWGLPGWHADQFQNTARQAFAHLWDSINADRGFGWDTNPRVWAITFKRIKP